MNPLENGKLKTLINGGYMSIIILLIGVLVYFGGKFIETQANSIEVMSDLKGVIERQERTLGQYNSALESNTRVLETNSEISKALVNLLSNTPILRQLKINDGY